MVKWNYQILNPFVYNLSKIGYDFSTKLVQKLKLSKIYLQKMCSMNKIQISLDIENSLWKSDLDTLWWPVSAVDGLDLTTVNFGQKS